ncbi:hypothetical protein ILT44_22475, partial [Microvirga sp. BT689]|uniref:hypothetical protein n=1 Tax=Microvirga arvi TaxID=2778731 RepID=UPI00195228AD
PAMNHRRADLGIYLPVAQPNPSTWPKVNKQLKKLIAEGKVERTARGRYRLVLAIEGTPEDDELVV